MTYRYLTYRASGFPWLGDLPEHWQTAPLKYLARLESGGTPSKDNREFWDGTVPWASAKDLKVERLADTTDHLTDFAVEEGGIVLHPQGTVLVVVRGMILAHTFPVVQTTVPMAINQDLKALHASPLLEKAYLAWTLRGLAHETLARVDEAGHGTKVLRIDSWVSMELPVPPLAEQGVIAEFLDSETAKIDALVAEQERLIELLAEKRLAVISYAVTKGLDPTVEMKDSRVDWLGAVPAHWDVMPIRLAAKLESGHTPSRTHPEYWVPEDCVFPWFTLADVWQIRDGETNYVYRTKECVSEMGLANSAARMLPKGTVMLSRTASVGFSTIMGIDMATTQDFANWVCAPSLMPEYLLWSFRGMAREFERIKYGSTHNTIYMPDLQAMRFARPPLGEQAAIVAHIEKSITQFRALIEDARRVIALLQERRTALISAAVTGKIDVRERGVLST